MAKKNSNTGGSKTNTPTTPGKKQVGNLGKDYQGATRISKGGFGEPTIESVPKKKLFKKK